MPLIKLNKLNKHYGGVHALKDVSLSVLEGSIVGLIGDNGAGKSTLMKCITGAVKSDSGSIEFKGEQVLLGNPKITRALGIEMVYQNLNLCPQLNSVDNIFLGKELRKHVLGINTPILDYKAMQTKALEILTKLNPNIDVHKPVGALSGGQQQAVAIARTLISDPKLLIMDEPTAALGVKETKSALGLIKKLKESGITIIIISHRLEDIFEVTDQIALMKYGEITENISTEKTSLKKIAEKILS